MAGFGRDNRLTFLQGFVCTGVAGITSRSVTAPLDVIKVLSQVGVKETQDGFAQAFINLYKSQGPLAFWKGNFMACLRLAPFNIIQFHTFHTIKLKLADENGTLTIPRALIAGCLGGMGATIVTYPTDMVKTRLIVQNRTRKRYRGILHAFRLILREEGALAFYRGLLVSLLGALPYSMTTFAVYELLDAIWGRPRYMYSPMQNFVNGCVAAAIAQTVCFPFDTIRKKLQAHSLAMKNRGGVDITFRGTIMAVTETRRKYGTRGFWRGNVANLCKIVPSAGLMFMSYEACKRMALFHNGYTVSLLDDTPKPNIDQTMNPSELKSWKERHIH